MEDNQSIPSDVEISILEPKEDKEESSSGTRTGSETVI